MSANSLYAYQLLKDSLINKYDVIINAMAIYENVALDSYKIAELINGVNGDIKPRLTEMYEKQIIKIVGNYMAKNKRVRRLYMLRKKSDPLNIIPKSDNDILKEKIEALKWYYGFETKAVEDVYRKYVEHTMQLKLEI
jgi:hypothetical protein